MDRNAGTDKVAYIWISSDPAKVRLTLRVVIVDYLINHKIFLLKLWWDFLRVLEVTKTFIGYEQIRQKRVPREIKVLLILLRAITLVGARGAKGGERGM